LGESGALLISVAGIELSGGKFTYARGVGSVRSAVSWHREGIRGKSVLDRSSSIQGGRLFRRKAKCGKEYSSKEKIFYKM